MSNELEFTEPTFTDDMATPPEGDGGQLEEEFIEESEDNEESNETEEPALTGEAASTEEPASTEEEEETPEQIIEKLRMEVTELTGKIPKAEATAPAAAPADETPDFKISLSDEEFDSFVTDKSKAEEVLTKAVQSYFQHVFSKEKEQLMLSMSGVMQQRIAEQVIAQTTAQEYFKQNEDLLPYAAVFTNEGIAIRRAHPELNIAQVYEEAGKAVRKKLGLRQKGVAPSVGRDGKQRNPAFALRGTRRAPAQRNVDPLRDDLDSIGPEHLRY